MGRPTLDAKNWRILSLWDHRNASIKAANGSAVGVSMNHLLQVVEACYYNA
jgi:hypothetical protein